MGVGGIKQTSRRKEKKRKEKSRINLPHPNCPTSSNQSPTHSTNATKPPPPSTLSHQPRTRRTQRDRDPPLIDPGPRVRKRLGEVVLMTALLARALDAGAGRGVERAALVNDGCCCCCGVGGGCCCCCCQGGARGGFVQDEGEEA